jgi:hypothetical protein
MLSWTEWGPKNKNLEKVKNLFFPGPSLSKQE